jgi:putative ABC transport system permease protein
MQTPWLNDVGRDVRYAARTLRRSPGFTFVAVLTLALGIGINATVFTVTNAVLFKGRPSVQQSNRILYIQGREWRGASHPDFEDWRAQTTAFEDMAAVTGSPMSVSDESGPAERYEVAAVTTNAFRLIGQSPSIGRDFVPSDAVPGAAPVAILTNQLWERRYGRDPAIVGKVVRVDGTPTTVIGVMAQGFKFPDAQQLWLPLMPEGNLQRRGVGTLWFVFGRMADGVKIQTARAEIQEIARRLEREHPTTNRGFSPVVMTMPEFVLGPNATAMYGAMWGAVGFVLLIACANLANLMLARAGGRSREISVRIALGASRWRIVRQVLIESLMLSAIGGLLGWLIASWGVRAYALVGLVAWKQPWFAFTIDYSALLYLIAISVGTGLLFGLAPALRLSGLDVNATLKAGSQGKDSGRRGKPLSQVLVIAEVALAVVLLAGAGVMIRSFLKIYTAELGVQPGNVLTASLGLPAERYPTPESQTSLVDRLISRLQAIPGVESVAVSGALPTESTFHFPFEIAGVASVGDQRRPTVATIQVSPAYFRTLGAAVVSGRGFTETDGAPDLPVVLVNEHFAGTYWPGADPIGRRLRLLNAKTSEAWLTVVGVVSNIVQDDVTGQRVDSAVYVPYRQRPTRFMAAVARTSVPPGSLAAAFRREIQALDSEPLLLDLKTLDERLRGNYQERGVNGALFAIFGAIALILASVGLYAVIAHFVSQRTEEIGVRVAVGATGREILTLVLWQGLTPVGVGLVIGLAAAFAVTPVLGSALVHVSPADPFTYMFVSVLLVLSATLGCLIPARRAMSVDPLVALRRQ